jgi:methylglutaconyl-CoA hydratase
MIDYQTIRLDYRGHLAVLWLAREKSRNAIDGQMARELVRCLDGLAADKHIRVVLLRGQGKVFCAGGDLNWMRMPEDPQTGKQPAACLSELFHKVYAFPKPLVCYVHGHAMGGALGLLAGSDFVVAEASAVFSFSEVKLGLAPATISPFVVRRIGEFAARRLMLAGNRIGAEEAMRHGLADRVAGQPGEDHETVLEELVRGLAGNAPRAMMACKELIKKVAAEPLSEALFHYTADLLDTLSRGPEAKEGMEAFLQKRSPRWSELS